MIKKENELIQHLATGGYSGWQSTNGDIFRLLTPKKPAKLVGQHRVTTFFIHFY